MAIYWLPFIVMLIQPYKNFICLYFYYGLESNLLIEYDYYINYVGRCIFS